MKNEKVKKDDIKYRLYAWTLNLITIIDTIPHSTTNDIIARQIVRSGTSVCANYVEGQAASSKKDFINYLHISLKSANETKYWLAILRDLKKADAKKTKDSLSELQEIANILAASLITLKKRKV